MRDQGARSLDQGQMPVGNSSKPLLLVAVRAELLEVGPEIFSLFFVLEAGVDHLGARNLGARVLDIVLEARLVPADAGILIGGRIAVGFGRAGMASVEAVQ